MDKKGSMVTLEEVEAVWGNSNFGPELNNNKLEVVKYSLLKCASGYYQGYTSKNISIDLGLIDDNYRLTRRGQFCLYEFFKGTSTL